MSDDVCANKHGGNPESVKAWKRAKHGAEANKTRIMNRIIEYGMFGRTADELSQELELPLHTTSACCTALKKANLVWKNGTRLTRLGSEAGVLVSVDFKPNNEGNV